MNEEIKYNQPLLPDPKGDRVSKDVIPPPHKPLPVSLLFPKDAVDWRILKEHLARGGIITKEDCTTIIKQATAILREEPNLIYIDDPLVIVGDIHGQYYDLLQIIEVGGDFNKSK